MGVPRLWGLLLEGLAKRFLLIAGGPRIAAVAEVQKPIYRIVNEHVEL